MMSAKSTLPNMFLTLLLVTVVSAVSLGFIYKLTEEPIKAAKIARQVKAIKSVLPAFDNDPLTEAQSILAGADSLTIYPGKNQGEKVGSAVKTYTDKGYSGRIWIMVGIDIEGNIHNIQVLEHKETPGLGSKLSDDAYVDQYIGYNPSSKDFNVTKDGGEIDAISGATISSKAFTEAVILAFDHIKPDNNVQ
ncbi:MAG: RnfABCDGE type electron transport complex subunit G [Cyclobacteriaceae bacterium]